MAIEEDLRRSEDSVVVINRQEEAEEKQQVGVAWSGWAGPGAGEFS